MLLVPLSLLFNFFLIPKKWLMYNCGWKWERKKNKALLFVFRCVYLFESSILGLLPVAGLHYGHDSLYIIVVLAYRKKETLEGYWDHNKFVVLFIACLFHVMLAYTRKKRLWLCYDGYDEEYIEKKETLEGYWVWTFVILFKLHVHRKKWLWLWYDG